MVPTLRPKFMGAIRVMLYHEDVVDFFPVCWGHPFLPCALVVVHFLGMK